MNPNHKRIAGMHVTKMGEVAIVWLSRDPDSDHVHVYDCHLFKNEVPAVIADALSGRGHWIPLAWANEEYAEQLREKKVRTLPEKTSDSDAMAETVSRDIWERARTGRISYDKRLQNWGTELKTLERSDGKIPVDSHPLMAATRIAIQNLRSAKRLQQRHKRKEGARSVAIV